MSIDVACGNTQLCEFSTTNSKWGSMWQYPTWWHLILDGSIPNFRSKFPTAKALTCLSWVSTVCQPPTSSFPYVFSFFLSTLVLKFLKCQQNINSSTLIRPLRESYICIFSHRCSIPLAPCQAAWHCGSFLLRQLQLRSLRPDDASRLAALELPRWEAALALPRGGRGLVIFRWFFRVSVKVDYHKLLIFWWVPKVPALTSKYKFSYR